MAIKYAIEKHATAFPAKVLAAKGGAHIYNVVVATDTDNGSLIARGQLKDFDRYDEATATTFKGKIWTVKAANGDYYVEVEEPGDALFVYTKPLIEETYSNKFKAESNFYNAEGDTVRAYELRKGDVLQVSAEAFNGEPTLGGAVDGIADKKMTVTA